MIVVLAGSLVKVALDVGLIQRYGLTGAVPAYGTTRVLMGLAVVGLALYHSGARLEWSRHVRALIAAALAAAAAWTVMGFMPVLPPLAAGGPLLAAVYAVSPLRLDMGKASHWAGGWK